MFGIVSFILEKIANANIKVTYQREIKDLEDRGMKKGKNVWISPGARIDHNYPYLISLGDNVVIGPRARLVAHDSTIHNFTDGHMRIGKIDIKENCIISMNSIILPGVTIGPNSIVAAGSVVNKDVPPNTCVAGVPARFYSKFEDMMERMKAEMNDSNVFKAVDISKGEDKDPKRIKAIKKAAEKGNVFIKGMESKYPIWLEGRDTG